MKKRTNILSWVFGFLLFATAHGQSSFADSVETSYKQYQQKQITTKEYLKHTGKLLDEQFAQGVLFKREDLVRILEPYKKIAWSADSLSAYRINYYINLSNNANYANREGESVYFLEKAEKEVNNHYQQRSLMVAGRKCNTYLDKLNYQKVIDTYKEYADYLNEFPTLIRNKAINLNISTSYINVINPAIAAYAKMRDTAQVEATLKLAENIYKELAEAINPQNSNKHKILNFHQFVNFHQNYLYFHKYFTLLDKRKESYQALEKMSAVLHESKYANPGIIGPLFPVLYTAKTDFFLHYGLNDSAAYYIDKLKDNAVDFGSHYYTIYRLEANLWANKGQYKEAYEAAMLAAHHIDSIQGVLVNDIDKMLYAHTASEENRALLVEAEKKEKERSVWILAISILSLLGFFYIYILNRKKNKRTQRLISTLNREANLQIAVLQEIKTSIRTEEQQRLAQDLHDNLAGTLAAIKNNITYLDNGLLSQPQQENIQFISSLLDKAYQQTRTKSHRLYEEGIIQQEETYIEHLRRLVQTALPSSRYETHIEIDKNTLMGTSIDLRIDILRIIQEILTNIIKHAYAQKVNMSIYKESDLLYIHIENDGRTFELHKVSTTKTFGLNSIRKRLDNMQGTMRIASKGIGTEITICIPQI